MDLVVLLATSIRVAASSEELATKVVLASSSGRREEPEEEEKETKKFARRREIRKWNALKLKASGVTKKWREDDRKPARAVGLLDRIASRGGEREEIEVAKSSRLDQLPARPINLPRRCERPLEDFKVSAAWRA